MQEAEKINDIDDTLHNDTEQYLTFLMGDEEYGIDIMKVMEIRGWEKPTMIPQAPTYIMGVINIRGTIVPIVDLRKRFSLADKAYTKITVVIVVQIKTSLGERVIGLIVDGVSEVYNLDMTKLKPAPEVVSDEESSYIKGLASTEDKMIILLDVEKIIDSEESIDFSQQLEQISQS